MCFLDYFGQTTFSSKNHCILPIFSTILNIQHIVSRFILKDFNILPFICNKTIAKITHITISSIQSKN